MRRDLRLALGRHPSLLLDIALGLAGLAMIVLGVYATYLIYLK